MKWNEIPHVKGEISCITLINWQHFQLEEHFALEQTRGFRAFYYINDTNLKAYFRLSKN